MRSYAAGFDGRGRFALKKNDGGYTELASTAFEWERDRTYEITAMVRGRGDLRRLRGGEAALEGRRAMAARSCGPVGIPRDARQS